MSTSISNTQVLFNQDPGAGWVNETHMQVSISHLPTTLKPGEILLKNLYLSLDPYMRGRMNTSAKSYIAPFEIGQPLQGSGISTVVQSKSNAFKAGDLVSAFIGWEEYTVVSDAKKILNTLNVPASYFLGVLGAPGATAYHGLINIGQPKSGETVFVSGAAGAVGLVVGQIAKIKGCRVIGSAGSDEKVARLTNEFGFDFAFNYKTVENLSSTIQKYCPSGIDIYFDNVGGETLDAVLNLMNVYGRIVSCGMISQYNLDKPYGMKNMMQIIAKQLKMQGFIVFTPLSDPEFVVKFTSEMTSWLDQGKIKYSQHLISGIENAPAAFVGMLNGANTGKQIIQICK